MAYVAHADERMTISFPLDHPCNDSDDCLSWVFDIMEFSYELELTSSVSSTTTMKTTASIDGGNLRGRNRMLYNTCAQCLRDNPQQGAFCRVYPDPCFRRRELAFLSEPSYIASGDSETTLKAELADESWSSVDSDKSIAFKNDVLKLIGNKYSTAGLEVDYQIYM